MEVDRNGAVKAGQASQAAIVEAIYEKIGRHILWWRDRPNRFCFLVLALVVAAMVCRAPRIFVHPRLWAEEGAFYYVAAHETAHTALWYRGFTDVVPAVGGYLHFWTCFAAMGAANWVSEENGPAVMLAFAIFAQLIPFAIVLWSRSSFWRSPGRKAMGVLILLFTPLSGEAWLNTLQSMVHFSILTLLLAIEDAPAGVVRRWIYRILLAIAGLSGPNSCILTPLFCVEAYFEKSRERMIQAGVLAVCAAVQFVLICFFGPGRTGGALLSIYGLALGTQCFGPMMLGYHETFSISQWLIASFRAGNFAVVPIAAFFALLAVAYLIVLAKNASLKERCILLIAFLSLSFISACGAAGEKASMILTGCNQRYFLTANIALLLLVVASAYGPSRFGRWLGTVMFAIAILWGVHDYRQTCFCNKAWPNWKTEVRAWRENPQHKLGIWPAGWTCDLNRTVRR